MTHCHIIFTASYLAVGQGGLTWYQRKVWEKYRSEGKKCNAQWMNECVKERERARERFLLWRVRPQVCPVRWEPPESWPSSCCFRESHMQAHGQSGQRAGVRGMCGEYEWLWCTDVRLLTVLMKVTHWLESLFQKDVMCLAKMNSMKHAVMCVWCYSYMDTAEGWVFTRLGLEDTWHQYLFLLYCLSIYSHLLETYSCSHRCRSLVFSLHNAVKPLGNSLAGIIM